MKKMSLRATGRSAAISTTFIILVVFISLFVRLGSAYLWKDSFFERGNRYNLINPVAQNIIHHKEFSLTPGNPTADNEPFYPLFVALSYFLFGSNWFSIALMQSIVNILNAVLISYITLKIFNNQKISIVAFLLFLFYPFYIFGSLSVSDTVFFCFWLALCTYLSIKCSLSGNFWISLAAGCSWGLALLTRFSAISLFPFAFIYFFINLPPKKAIRTGIIVLFACLITLAPWVYRNYKLTGKFFITTHGAIEIWLGYNKDSLRVISHNISVDTMKKNLTEKIPELKEIREKDYSAPILREVEEKRIFLKNALNFARSNPWLSIKMMPIKFWKLWTWNYNPVPSSQNSFEDLMRRVVYTLSYLPILVLALYGIVLTRHFWRSHSILFLLFFGYSLLHTVVYGFSRLRVPIDQFLIIYSAYTVIYFLKKLKKFLPEV